MKMVNSGLVCGCCTETDKNQKFSSLASQKYFLHNVRGHLAGGHIKIFGVSVKGLSLN